MELKPGGCTNIDELTVRAHDCIHEGTRGRAELVQESHTKWEAQLPPDITDTAKWNDFKAHHSNELQEHDEAGLTTAKARRANSIVANEQSAFNDKTL